MKWGPLFDVTFPNSSKQFQCNISRPSNNGKFWTWNHLYFVRWKIWSSFIFGNSAILVTSWSQNWAKRNQVYILYSNCDKKKTNSIAMVFSRLVIHFWDQFFKTVILWPIPNPSLLRHFNIRSKEIRICIYY